MDKLSQMHNIGATLEKKLIKVGIETQEALIETGSKEAFIKLRLEDDTACFNMLCALEGAVEGIRWHYLSDEKKKELKSFIETLG